MLRSKIGNLCLPLVPFLQFHYFVFLLLLSSPYLIPPMTIFECRIRSRNDVGITICDHSDLEQKTTTLTEAAVGLIEPGQHLFLLHRRKVIYVESTSRKGGTHMRGHQLVVEMWCNGEF